MPYQVFDDLQTLTGKTETTGWIQPANAGDTGGPDPTKPHGIFVMTPGQIATFSAKGARPYNNGYWYTKRMGQESSKFYIHELAVLFPTVAELQACNGLEFEVQQSLNGKLYDFAWQFRHPGAECSLYSFDKTKVAPEDKWQPTGIALPSSVWKTGAMVPIISTSMRNDDGTLTYLSLSVGGIELLRTPISAPALVKTEKNYMSVGFQLDTNGKNPPTPYTVRVTDMKVTAAW
jgi:hypothetical protein